MKLKIAFIVLLLCFVTVKPASANWYEQGSTFWCETEAECLLLMGNPWPLDPKNDSQLRRMFYFFGLEEPQLFNTVINIRNKICNVVGDEVDEANLPCLANGLEQGYNGYVKNANGVMVEDPMPVEWGLAKHWFPEAYQLSGPAYHGQKAPVGLEMSPVGSTFWGTNKERLYSMTLRFAEKNKAPVYTLKKPLQVTDQTGIFGPVGALGKGTTEIFESDEFWPRFEWRHTRKKDGRLEKKNLPKFVKDKNFDSKQECGVVIKSPGLHMGFDVSGFKVGICIEAERVILSGVSATNNQIGIKGKNFVIVDSYVAYNKTAGIKGHHFLALNNVINKNGIGIDIDYSGAGGPASVFFPTTLFKNNTVSVPYSKSLSPDWQFLLKANSLPPPKNLVVNADNFSWHISGFLDPKGNYGSDAVTVVVFKTDGANIARLETAKQLIWPTKPESKTVTNAKGDWVTSWNDVAPLPFSVSLPKSEEEGALQVGDTVIVQLYPGDWSVIDEPKPDSPDGWLDYYDSIMESFVAVTSGKETANSSALGSPLTLPKTGGFFPPGGGVIVPKGTK